MNPSNDMGYGYTDVGAFNVFINNVDNCDMPG